MEVEEIDNCRSCGQVLEVEHLIVTECGDILCAACMGHHDCSTCFPSEHDSDSSYIASEEKSSSEDESEDDYSEED